MLLNKIGSSNTVFLRWVKAHVGHVGNEAADGLAKAGALDEDLLVADLPLMTNKLLHNELRKLVVLEWDRYWNAEEPCRQTKHFFPHIDRKLSQKICTGRRTVFSAVVHIITGQNFLQRQKYSSSMARM